MTHLHRLAALAAATLIVAGCGGGGGDAGIPGTTQFAVQSAYRNLLNATATWSLTGIGSDAAAYRIDLGLRPAAAAVFAVTGTTGSVSEQFQRLVRNGSVLGEGTTRVYFNASTLALLGSDDGDGTCSVVTVNTALPMTATIGASGALTSANDLAACSAGAAVVGSSTTTWSLEAESGFALLCQNAVLRNAAGATDGTGAQCIEIAADGSLGARMRMRLDVGSFSLTARNY